MEGGILISKTDVLKLARKKGFPAGTIEKEYVLTLFLERISGLKTDLVFKGGTALSKIYLNYYRISEDLDFTYAGSGVETIIKTIRAVCKSLEMNIKDENKTPYSYNVKIGFIGPLEYQNHIKIDISMREKLIFKPKTVVVRSFYEEIKPFSIRVYDLREIVAEKIRTLIQRKKPRDYFDVWFVLKNKEFDSTEIRNAVIEKCKRIGVGYEPEKIFSGIESVKKQWKTDLTHLVIELADFDTVKSNLKTELGFLL